MIVNQTLLHGNFPPGLNTLPLHISDKICNFSAVTEVIADLLKTEVSLAPMGGCMDQWVGSGQMTNLIQFELINII